MEMVPNSNFAHRVRLSQVNMLCIVEKYRLCEFYLNALAGKRVTTKLTIVWWGPGDSMHTVLKCMQFFLT